MDLLQGKNLVKADGSKVDAITALGTFKIICFYFSADWCERRKVFDLLLMRCYEKVAERGVKVILVSSDKSEQEMFDYMSELPSDWFAVEHGSETSAALKDPFYRNELTSLTVVNSDGKVITREGHVAIKLKGLDAFDDWL